MTDDKVRLGGMALQNGVLVHGPRAWAAAIRLPDGRMEVAAAQKRLRAADVGQPFLRGPARLFEALAILPELRRRLPAAKLPFERPGVLAATTELFGWMVRNPERPLARALARPGHELQHRLATAEPTPEQLEVAEAALRACLALEHGDHRTD